MIKVVVELWPFGDENHKRTISTFDIANDGTGTAEYGNYKVRFDGAEEWEPSFKGYARKSNVLYLLYKVLEQKYG